MSDNTQLSIVIPVYNEEDSLAELHQWLLKVMNDHHLTYEIIFVDDGSTDNSWQRITQICLADPRSKGVRFSRNNGKSAAFDTAFKHSCGDVVITMDADLQDSPDEIPGLYKMVVDKGFDLVSGWKKKRRDPISKRLPSKFFNFVTRLVSGIKLHDFNCGLKAYRKEVVNNISVYGEMHRYIPVIVKWNGFSKIGEKVVQHYPRKYGKTKYGVNRFIFGFLDLISISFVSKFMRRPMHFFGVLGTLSFLFGLGFVVKIIWDKIDYIYFSGDPITREITEQPLFYLALVAVIAGVQLFLAGFLAEMINSHTGRKHNYLITDSIRINRK